jgi:hypothetical protein
MREQEAMECNAHTPAPEYQRVFDFHYREALNMGAPVSVAEQAGADAASEFLHPQRPRSLGAKDFP